MPKYLLNTTTLIVSKAYESDELEDLTDEIDELDDDEIAGAFVFDTDTLRLVTAESLI